MGESTERYNTHLNITRQGIPPVLLAAMSEVLPRLYGLALEDWGVNKQDRLAPRSEDPQRTLVSRVAAA